MRISLANDSTREQTWRQKDLEIQSLLSAVGFWGEIFSSRLKSFNSCVPRFSFFFFKSRFFTSLLLRFSGEVDVLSQVVWAVKCNLLSVASSNMYSTHNISPLSLSRLLSALLLTLFSATQWNLRLNFHSNEITINYIGCPTKWGVRRVLASL